MATTEDIRNVVRQYVERVSAHQPDKVADLFADGATIEDPVGTELKTDRAAIVDFFAVIAGMEETTTDLRWCKVAADTAVFEFCLRVSTAGQGLRGVTGRHHGVRRGRQDRQHARCLGPGH